MNSSELETFENKVSILMQLVVVVIVCVFRSRKKLLQRVTRTSSGTKPNYETGRKR
jgi:hypothetical protein